MTPMDTYTFHMPTRILSGAGAVSRLAAECASLGRRPLIVTGRNSARACGLLDRVLAQFPEAAVFTEVEENPGTAVCDRGGLLCREKKCDFVIALGGGSPMDAAKVIAVLATNDTKAAELFGADKYAATPLPIVAVPTTAGTGSEVTPYSVLTDESQGMKRTVKGASLFPALAVLDPETQVSMPRSVTIATGLDALSQVMEGLVSRNATPPGDVLALDACRLVRRWLPVAVREPGSLEAREAMLRVAMYSGVIIAQSGTTMVHGMGYYYTLRHGLAHGLANGLLLAPMFAFNAREVPGKVAALAAALGCPVESDDPDEVAEAVAGGVHALFGGLGVSPAARDHGVPESVLDGYADEVAGDPYRFRNQPGVITPELVRRLYHASWEGAW